MKKPSFGSGEGRRFPMDLGGSSVPRNHQFLRLPIPAELFQGPADHDRLSEFEGQRADFRAEIGNQLVRHSTEDLRGAVTRHPSRMALHLQLRTKKAWGILREFGGGFMDRLGWVPRSLQAPGRHVILMYHGVVPDRASRFNWRHVSTADFECHLRLLRKHCHLLSMADLHAGKVSGDRLNVVLTFDDGFQNNFLHALPLLEKYQAPASFYITGANEIGVRHLWPDFLDILSRHAEGKLSVGGMDFVKRGKAYFDEDSGESLASIIKHRYPDWNFKLAAFEAFKRWQPNLYRPDYRPFWELMTDEQIREVANSDRVTIGCHGYFHNNLGELPLEDALSELRKSRAYLERITGKQVRELAFPDGSYSPQLVREAMNQGFDVVLGTEHHYGEAALSAAPYRRAGIYSFKPRRAQLLDAVGLERKGHL